jgi:DNA-binding winged helix-turn-helix (wHTH) protein/tetratricopeptide (TPR) repeat protein
VNGDIRVGSKLIRPQLNVVVSDHDSIKVEPRVMQVLLCLVDNAGDVVSKDRLLQSVWGETFVGEEALTNAVSLLRKALGDDPRQPAFIQTVAKRGYRLIAPVSDPSSIGATAAEGSRRARRAASPRRQRAAVGVTAMLALFFAVLTVHLWGPPPRVEEDPWQALKPSVAVLYFENVAGDPSLEWLRTGLTEMLVTDLSQSPDIRVVPTDRLHHILKRGGALHERASTSDVVRLVAEEAGAQVLILGSFARKENRLRIQVRLQDARTGDILASEKVETQDESDVLELVDELAARIKSDLDIVETADRRLDRGLKEVTTSSPLAFRYYAESIFQTLQRADLSRAASLMERAVELDPGFALALSKLSMLYENMGRFEEGEAAARRAVQHKERLSERERWYIEGNAFSLREDSYPQAIDCYRRAVMLYPDHAAARHNLGALYFRLELYPQAAGVFEELVRLGIDSGLTYSFLAATYAALGEIEREKEVLEAYRRRRPDDWLAYRNLGAHFMRWGKLDEARQAIASADALRPAGVEALDRWPLEILVRERRTTADTPVFTDAKPCIRQRGPLQWLHRGQSERALSLLEEVRAGPTHDRVKAAAANLAAHILLETGAPERALSWANDAERWGRANAGEWEALFNRAVALARQGRATEAALAAEELRLKAHRLPSHREIRRHHHLLGELALARGQPSTAIFHLRQAESLLPPRGVPGSRIAPTHVPIWYALATAFREAGDAEQAIVWYRKVAESGIERVNWPILYVRSFHFLGDLSERLGRRTDAQGYYQRFRDLWQAGDLDRRRVARAVREAAPARTPLPISY